MFAFIFTTISSAFANIRAAVTGNSAFLTNDGIKVALYLEMNIVAVALMLLLVYTVCSVTTSTSGQALQLKQQIQKINRHKQATVGQAALMEAIDAYIRCELTGWRLFSINRTLLLSSLSSIITFSVLICQLAPGIAWKQQNNSILQYNCCSKNPVQELKQCSRSSSQCTIG